MNIYIKAPYFLAILLLTLLCNNCFSQSGCCSWHQGVNGCDTYSGKILCNDGTTSSSCACDSSQSSINNSEEDDSSNNNVSGDDNDDSDE